MSRISSFRCTCPDCGRHDGNPNFIFGHMYREHMDAHPGETPWMLLTHPREFGWADEDEDEDVAASARVVSLDRVGR